MSVCVGEHRTLGEADIDPEHLQVILDSVYKFLDLPVGDIDVSLVDDPDIMTLNQEYRQKDSPTNVLSFPHYLWTQPRICRDISTGRDYPPTLWGEIIVSCETVKRDSESGNVPFLNELIRMCIHGMLHIFGYDHETDDDYEEMLIQEQKAMDFAMERMQKSE